MSLARIEPDVPDDHSQMFFDCVCGFEYGMPRAEKVG